LTAVVLGLAPGWYPTTAGPSESANAGHGQRWRVVCRCAIRSTVRPLLPAGPIAGM